MRLHSDAIRARGTRTSGRSPWAPGIRTVLLESHADFGDTIRPAIMNILSSYIVALLGVEAADPKVVEDDKVWRQVSFDYAERTVPRIR